MSLISKETLLMQLQRSEMASEVTLPIDSFRDLLYQAMPKEWVGLTHEEISVEWFAVFDAEPGIGKNITNGVFDFANAIEAKLKKKNAF